MTEPWYYRWRFTNWLIAKPWPRRNGWRYRTIYRTLRRGCDGWIKFETGEHRFYESMVRRPLSRPFALWKTLTFPHVHHGDDV